MKRRWCALVALAVVFSLAGCGAKQAGEEVVAETVTVEASIGAEETAGATGEATTESEAGTTEAELADTTETEEEILEVKELTLLKTKGKNIYDQGGEGELIQLKGVNVGGWLLQEFWMTPTDGASDVWAELDVYRYLTETYGEEKMWEIVTTYQDAYFTEADFDNCQKLGMNCLRLPFWYLNFVDMEGNVREDWYVRLDWFIENAKERGMYVILDMHGAPGSQNASDHSGKDGGANKMLASELFWGENSTSNQELFYELWEMIAERYKDEPAVAAYDLLNEPYCTYRYNTPYSDDMLHAVLWNTYDKAYDRIRAIDPDHIIMMEATWDPVDLPNPDDYEWTNVVYEYHNYLYDDYNNEKGQQIANMEKKLDLIRQANYNVPSYMGEFNYMNNYDAWAEGLELLNNEGIHWTMWTYKTVIGYENWGLFNQNIGDITLQSKTDEEIIEFYKKVGESFENTKLTTVVKEYLKQEAVEAK